MLSFSAKSGRGMGIIPVAFATHSGTISNVTNPIPSELTKPNGTILFVMVILRAALKRFKQLSRVAKIVRILVMRQFAIGS